MKVLMAEVNISEGTQQSIIQQVKEALLAGAPLELIDLDSSADHNRTVFTYKGEPTAVLEGTKRLAAKAVELIDMTKHHGGHPRMGAIDVVPFIPVKDVTLEEALDICHAFAAYLGGELGVPVYYYEEAATREERKTLPKIRKGEYEALEEKFKDLATWAPDEGPQTFNAKSGATVTGVRFPLIAFNVNLKTDNIDIAKEIVKAVRGATGGYQHVRAIALPLEDRDIIQISMNLTNYEKTPIHRVFETIKSEALARGILVEDTELVGPVPVYALEDVLKHYLQAWTFNMDQIYF